MLYIHTLQKLAPSHYIGKSPYEPGEGTLNRNFIVYDNDANILEEKLCRIRIDYDPDRVIAEFSTKHPELVRGDVGALASVIAEIASRKIGPGIGKSYLGLENHIVADLPSGFTKPDFLSTNSQLGRSSDRLTLSHISGAKHNRFRSPTSAMDSSMDIR
jgi:hypothetical protein